MTRVRFAPAPTGFLHIGGARTYLFNWLFARKNQGQLVLRIGDTDVEGSAEASLRPVVAGLKRLKRPWDERHHQSEQRRSHQQAAEALLEKGLAYRDFTAEHGEADRKEEERGLGRAERLAGLPEFFEGSVEESPRAFASEHRVKPGVIIHAARSADRPAGAFAVFATRGRERIVDVFGKPAC